MVVLSDVERKGLQEKYIWVSFNWKSKVGVVLWLECWFVMEILQFVDDVVVIFCE